jgi:hypothetical protein
LERIGVAIHANPLFLQNGKPRHGSKNALQNGQKETVCRQKRLAGMGIT